MTDLTASLALTDRPNLSTWVTAVASLMVSLLPSLPDSVCFQYGSWRDPVKT